MNMKTLPLPRVNGMHANPILEELPHTNGETAMHEEVVIGFFGLLAKQAQPAIFPTSPPKPIRRPKPILESKPSMVLFFWSRPSLPN
jgi:hypothetical protein